jgi:REase_AHJR-like
MNIEQRLNDVADRYRAQGYQVVVRPGPDALPRFAKDFKVEILAARPDGNVLASAKGSPSELAADRNLSRYAEVIENQPGWRFDLFVLGPDPQQTPEKRDVKEPSEEEIRRSLDEAERMLRAGFVAQSVIASWAALESAMRHSLRAQGSEAGWGTSSRMMLNELFSSGVLSNSVFRDLEGLFQLRSVIVHGFSAPAVEPSAVQFLIDTARGLLNESRPAKQTA